MKDPRIMKPKQYPTRRTFLGSATGMAATSAITTGRGQGGEANAKLVVGVMGMGGRGCALAESFRGLRNVEVAMVCDVDRTRADSAAKKIGGRVKAVTDFRRILDRQDVDILVIATCNHWHAPAAILACAANKHVYVEKPCSHNPHEGELLVQASQALAQLFRGGVGWEPPPCPTMEAVPPHGSPAVPR